MLRRLRLLRRSQVCPSSADIKRCLTCAREANALNASATVFDTLCEVDTKFAKLVDNECEGISTEVKKWFKRLAVRSASSVSLILADLTVGMARRRRSVSMTRRWPLTKGRSRMLGSTTSGKSRRILQTQSKNTTVTSTCSRPLGKTLIKRNSTTSSFQVRIHPVCLTKSALM